MSGLANVGITSPARILAIEDATSFALELSEFLSTAGHSVLAITGVDQLENDRFAPRTILFGTSQENLNLKEFEFCFLDHYFESENMNGTTLMPFLVSNNVGVIGMSSSRSANERMKSLGAYFAVEKRLLGKLLGF